MRYFTLSEFDSNGPGEGGTGSNMNSEFLLMIDEARHIAGIPFKISSGFRTPAHNANIGGSPTSSHQLGYAADIQYWSHKEALRIITACYEAGFRRIGLADNFVHVDNDPNKPEAYWGYE